MSTREEPREARAHKLPPGYRIPSAEERRHGRAHAYACPYCWATFSSYRAAMDHAPDCRLRAEVRAKDPFAQFWPQALVREDG